MRVAPLWRDLQTRVSQRGRRYEDESDAYLDGTWSILLWEKTMAATHQPNTPINGMPSTSLYRRDRPLHAPRRFASVQPDFFNPLSTFFVGVVVNKEEARQVTRLRRLTSSRSLYLFDINLARLCQRTSEISTTHNV